MKMTCVHCEEITECSCPDDHAKEFENAKYICDVCMELMDKGVNENELKTSPRRREVEQNMKANLVADYMADQMLEAYFEPFWKEAKNDIRERSKKEIAEISYGEGAHAAIVLCSKMAMDNKLNEILKQAKEREQEEDHETH